MEPNFIPAFSANQGITTVCGILGIKKTMLESYKKRPDFPKAYVLTQKAKKVVRYRYADIVAWKEHMEKNFRENLMQEIEEQSARLLRRKKEDLLFL